MIALIVHLNGKRVAIAGADDLCVLHAIVTAAGELGKSTARVGKRRGVNMHMTVGGLTGRANQEADEHLRWVNLQRLRVGDKITVEIVRSDKPDQHASATPAVRDVERQQKFKARVEERIRSAKKLAKKKSSASNSVGGKGKASSR